jgi:uncharacterized membrane protein
MMTQPSTRPHQHLPAVPFDIEGLVGYILLGGVLCSVALLVIGLLWHWLTTGHLHLTYTITGMNFFQFVLTDLGQVASGHLGPRLCVNLGLAVLLLTPYMRIVASMLYFAVVEHNGKYTVFTGFVLSVLTYSLFFR